MISKFMGAFTGIKSVIAMFSGSGDSQGGGMLPKGILWFRYGTRFLLLIMVLFIFVWWPVEAYTPEGFDGWSARMSKLPAEVWYVLLGVILSWGVSEFAMGRRGGAFTSMTTGMYSDGGYGGGYGGFDGGYSSMDPMMGMDGGPPLDGRFANVTEDDPAVLDNSTPNPVVEEWRERATE